MKHLLEVCLVAAALATGITPSVTAQSPAAVPENSFVGTWEGRINDLPGIDLKIQEIDRKISGTIIFYFQERVDRDGPLHPAGESAVPLLAANVEGGTLTFEVQHHRCHGCQELGPNVKFRMALAGPNEARLRNLTEDTTPELKLIRETESTGIAHPALQKGISVQLPVTSNARPMPDADHEDALIVSVTADGSVHLGVNPVSFTGLAEKVTAALSNRTEKKLYIKADARTPYANVVKVLDAVRTVGVEAQNLLTAQPDSSKPGTLVPPKGLEVLVGPPFPLVSDAIIVQVINSGQQRPALKINNEPVSWAALQNRLRQSFKNRSAKVIQIKADGILPFADIVDVIDACRSTGANVDLVTTGL